MFLANGTLPVLLCLVFLSSLVFCNKWHVVELKKILNLKVFSSFQKENVLMPMVLITIFL